MPSRRRLACLVLLMLLAGGTACGSTSFGLGTLTVDATHTCPTGASNAPYDLHAKVDANNPTSQPVTVRSASAAMILAAVHGLWQEKVGTRYDAGQATFSPTSIGAGSNITLKVTIRSACSNPAFAGFATNYADYNVELTLDTSAGAFKLTSQNRHRILAP